MQVIPVVNCLHLECVEEKLAKAREFLEEGDWIKIDIADGIFTFHKTWNNPSEWANLRVPYKLELHLMVEEPEKYVEPWIAAGAKRLIVHFESLKSEDYAKNIIAKAKKRGAESALSSNPMTTTAQLWPYLKLFSHFQVLAVDPGLPGQKFIPKVLEKIKFLRNFAPNATIEVDGGVNPETARLARNAGADVLAAATYIFGNKNPKKAFKTLQKL